MRVPAVEQSSMPQSPPATAPSQSSFFTQYKLLPPNSVALGRLVIDPWVPGQDFCDEPVELTTDEIAVSRQPRLRATVENARGSQIYDKLVRVFSCFMSDGDFPVVQEKTYSLLNSGKCFKKLCDNENTRKWFEATIKYGWSVYMVVGIHTVHSSSVRFPVLENNVPQDVGTDNNGIEVGAPGPGELVFGVQYRKVQFRWFSSRKIDNAFLNMGWNRWKVFAIGGRNFVEDEEDDIVDASLQQSIVEDDIKDLERGEVYITNDQLIVL